MTEVSYSITRTINLGNYESVRVQAGLTLTVNEQIPGDVENQYNFAKDFVDTRIEEETEKWNE